MAAVHAAIRLVSPIETTIHSGEIITLIPGKSGTINLILNNEMDKEFNTNSAHFDSFVESFGDEFKDQEDFKKFVLVRTGAHFRFTGDKQFVTVVYSGSGRMVFNFDSDSHTNPMQKLYVENQQPGGFVVTNNAKSRDGTDNLHFGYSLFDIPACTSEIQTDILVDLSLINDDSESTDSDDGSESTDSDDDKLQTAANSDDDELQSPISDNNELITVDNSENYIVMRTDDTSVGTSDARPYLEIFSEFVKRINQARHDDTNTDVVLNSYPTDIKKVLYDLSATYDTGSLNEGVGYIKLDERTKSNNLVKLKLRLVPPQEYKHVIRNLRNDDLSGTYFSEQKENFPTYSDELDDPNDPKQRRILANLILGLDDNCLPEELFDEIYGVADDDVEKALETEIKKCDQMRVPQDGGQDQT